MCGRYTRDYTWSEIHAMYSGKVKYPDADPEPAYNVAPTQPGWVIAHGKDGLAAVEMKWGLLPPWAKDPKIAYSTINARLETVTVKPAFRSAWKSRRCIIPASGYYEWPVIDGVKRPQYIYRKDAPALLLGGLWEQRDDGDGGRLLTYSIVTKDADPSIAELHDRMPLILDPDAVTEWIEGDGDTAMALATTAPEPPMAFHEVAKAVGNIGNQGKQLTDAINA